MGKLVTVVAKVLLITFPTGRVPAPVSKLTSARVQGRAGARHARSLTTWLPSTLMGALEHSFGLVSLFLNQNIVVYL